MKPRWIILAIALTLAGGRALAEEPTPFPEDPAAGARLFQQKGCLRCHAIGDEESKIGPNLGRIHLKGSLLDVAGAMWNHAPMMHEKMEELRLELPQLTPQEMANLVAFLTAYQYYLTQLGKPGDPAQGQQVFEKKHCAQCHSLQSAADFEKVGPSLRGYAKLSPIQFAQAMWNHAAPMAEEFRKLNLAQPQFTNAEMADLLAYLQTVAAPQDAEPVYIQPGSPRRGRELFQTKGCATCHALHGVGGTPDVPDLGKRREELVRSVTEVAGIMWNHGAAMTEKMRERHVPIVKFAGNEMADIIAYLYFTNYFDKPGNAARGEDLFTKKSCAQCHSFTEGRVTIGPNLRTSRVIGSPIETVTAMWNHARIMRPAMHTKGIPWPKFEPGEMSDLMEFIYLTREKRDTP
jgi:cytochrome c2